MEAKLIGVTTWTKKSRAIETYFATWCKPCSRVKPLALEWFDANGWTLTDFKTITVEELREIIKEKIPLFRTNTGSLQHSDWSIVEPFLNQSNEWTSATVATREATTEQTRGISTSEIAPS